MVNAGQFSSRVLHEISKENRGVVIDTSRLSYINSAGVRVLWALSALFAPPNSAPAL